VPIIFCAHSLGGVLVKRVRIIYTSHTYLLIITGAMGI
jgi:hypothetical protein